MWSRVFGKGVCSRHRFTAVLRLAEKRFTADDDAIMDSMVQLLRMKKEKGGKKEGRAPAGRVDGQKKEEAAQTLWGMLYADDAGIVSRSPERLEKMMTVIVTVCAAFGLTYRKPRRRSCACNQKVGGTCRSPLLQLARCTNKRSSLCTWAGLSAQIGISEVSR